MKNFLVATSLTGFIVAPNARATEVTLGLVSNFSELTTGSSNPYLRYFTDAIQMALDDSAARLKKKNIVIKVQQFDYGVSDSKVPTVTRAAIASGAIALLGYNYSSSALLAAPLLHEAKVPMLTPSATANRLSTFGRYIHMASFDNAFMGENLARIATENLKTKRAVLIPASNCAYCTDLADSFERSFKASGGEIAAKLPILTEDRDFSELVDKLKSQDFDVVLLPNQELVSARVISALYKAGLNRPFLGADGWGNLGNEFFGVLKKMDITGYSLSHWDVNLPSPRSKNFAREYEKRFSKVPGDTAVLAYDSTLILVDALLTAKTLDREGVENALSAMKHFEGITGHFLFSPNKAPRKSMVMEKTQNGQFVFQQTIEPTGGNKK